jgi:hypothetical protein
VLSIAGISAFAAPVNITVFDGEGSGTGWYGTNEDQEVSNGCVTGQQWDLEAFKLDGSSLSLVGGYNFKNGEVDPYYSLDPRNRLPRYNSGDIFIDVTGNAKYGSTLPSQGYNANKNVLNSNGWDYVLDLNMEKLTYDVFKIDASDIVSTSFFNINSDANPWRYVSGGEFVTSGTIGYVTGLTNAQTGFTGGSHNMLTVDLSFLGNTNFTAHYTMQCGNDNIIGKGTVRVPEPTAISLLGSGFLFLAMFFRKRKV